MNKRSYAWLTGLFVVTGLVIGAALLITLRGPGWLAQGYEVYVELAAGNGLAVGSPVKFAGVDIGEVRGVRIRRQNAARPIELALWIRQDVTLYADDQALIGLLGVLGEKYVEILPGDERKQRLQPQGRLLGVKPITEAALTQQLQRTLVEFETALKKVNQLTVDPQPWLALKAQVEKTLVITQDTLLQTQGLIATLEATRAQVASALERWQALGQSLFEGMEALKRWGPWALGGVLLLWGVSLFV